MKTMQYAVLAGAFLTSLPAHAAPVPDADLSAAYKNCMAARDALQGALPAMMGCTQSELKLRDAELNNVYNILMGSLDGDQRPKLLAAQKAWIAFREANCDQKNSSGEKDDLVGRANCVLQMTIDRTKEIQDMLDDD